MSRPLHTYPPELLQRIAAEADRLHPRSIRYIRFAVHAPIFAALYGAIGYGFSLLWTHYGPTVACIAGGAIYGAHEAWSTVTSEWVAERKADIEEALWIDTTPEGAEHMQRILGGRSDD